MESDRWQKIEYIFNEALAHSHADRDKFLESACEGDLDLRLEIERLLGTVDQPYQFFSKPAFTLGARLLA